MQFAHRQRLFRTGWSPMLVGIPLGLLLGFLGPFGSSAGFSTAIRYAFWLGLTMVGVASALAADALLATAKLRLRALRIGAVTALSAVPMTFIVAWTVLLIRPGRTYSPGQTLALFWGVAAIQLLIVLAAILTSPKGAGDSPPQPASAPPEAPPATRPPAFPAALLGKLPEGAGGEILALETEDHYLRIHAARGSGLVLMRMADAVALLDPRLGGQVHRRWWVAEAAVVDLRVEAQKPSLRLSNGMAIPVGRTFLANVKARFGATGDRKRPKAGAEAAGSWGVPAA